MSVVASSSHAEQRRAQRHEVSFQGWLLGDGGRRRAVHIVDISRHGLMLRSSGEAQRGERIVIDLPRHGRHHAVVRWVLGGRIGCEFAEPLPEPQLRAILAAPPAPPSPWVRF